MARHYKTPRGKHRQNLYDINHSKIVFDPPPREMDIEMEIKTKINKWDLTRLKTFA